MGRPSSSRSESRNGPVMPTKVRASSRDEKAATCAGVGHQVLEPELLPPEAELVPPGAALPAAMVRRGGAKSSGRARLTRKASEGARARDDTWAKRIGPRGFRDPWINPGLSPTITKVTLSRQSRVNPCPEPKRYSFFS